MRSIRIAAMAMEGLRRTPLRVILTTLGVSIAAAALVTLVAFALGLQRQVERPFRALGLLNNIQVTPRGEGRFESGRSESGPALDDEALARMAEIPGVTAAYPEIRARGIQLRHGEKSETALALGVPREAAWFGVEPDLIVAGRFLEQDGQPEAILGTQLLKELGFASPEAAVGATITLEAAGLSPEDAKSFTVERKTLSVAVVGVYKAPPIMPPASRRAVLLPVDLMKELPGTRLDVALNQLTAGRKPPRPGYGAGTVRVAEPADLPAVESRIGQMGFQAKSMASRLQGMRILFVVLEVLLAAIGSVALLIAALGIINTLLMSVLERYQEIGIYKAIGASALDLFVLFVTEAGIIGCLGGIGGITLGWLVSWGLEALANVHARRWEVMEHVELFAFPLWLLAGTVVFSVLISVLAGVYPAMRAARIDAIRALRRE